MINVIDIQSNVIIITSFDVNSFRLSKLMKTDAIKWIWKNLTTYKTLKEKKKRNKQYSQFLSWLWSSCVEAILQKIHNRTLTILHSLSQIWWIKMKIINYLSFHAADDHFIKFMINTFHWMISSYTSTIKTLAHAREKILMIIKSQNDKAKLLIVTMLKTSGEIDLSEVKREMSEIQLTVKFTFSYQSLVQLNVKMMLK